MLKGLLYWLITLLPELTVPFALQEGIGEAVTYCYWANYYIPVDIALKCFGIYIAYVLSCNFIKFLVHTLSSFL